MGLAHCIAKHIRGISHMTLYDSVSTIEPSDLQQAVDQTQILAGDLLYRVFRTRIGAFST